jgi:hypothetical protein
MKVAPGARSIPFSGIAFRQGILNLAPNVEAWSALLSFAGRICGSVHKIDSQHSATLTLSSAINDKRT